MENPKDKPDLVVLAGAVLASGLGVSGAFPTFRQHNDRNVRAGVKPRKNRDGQRAKAAPALAPARAKAKAARKARKINRRKGK